MNQIEHMLQDLAETRAAEPKPKPQPCAEGHADRIVVQLPVRPGPSRCDTLWHEYDFGVCLDCEGIDPNFEPDDDMILQDYLRGYDGKAAA